MISASRAGLSCRLARRGLRYSLQSGMVHSCDATHRVDEVLPRVALKRQDTAAFGRQTVETAATLTLFLHPFALQPASLLQPIKKRIERSDMKLQLSVGARFDELADLISVTSARFDDGEDDQFRRSLLQLAV